LRLRALRVLGGHANPVAHDALLDGLLSDDSEFRITCLEGLRNQGYDDLQQMVIGVVRHRSFRKKPLDEQKLFLRTLATFVGSDVEKALLAELRGGGLFGSRARRAMAIEVLSDLSNTDHPSLLLKAVRGKRTSGLLREKLDRLFGPKLPSLPKER
ncbi:MAG: hypothetical protein KC561_17845, partial [Myxococcales bacterium]|nr:hypothetical protein [Myxococcales bacterium]